MSLKTLITINYNLQFSVISLTIYNTNVNQIANNFIKNDNNSKTRLK